MTKTLALVIALASGCGKPEAAPDPEPSTSTVEPAQPATSAASAQEVFTQRCVPCHGATGHGDGPASASLNPKPRQYVDAAWQASVTDDYLIKIIKYGGAGVGKSPAMPNNPDLDDATVAGLKDVVRSFGKK